MPVRFIRPTGDRTRYLFAPDEPSKNSSDVTFSC